MENDIISNPSFPYVPTVVDDFCGTGGLTLGCKQAGFRTLLAIDNDPHAVESHRLNFSEIPVLRWDRFIKSGEDILNETGLLPGELDLYTAGAPCPPFSGENSNKKRDDVRVKLTLNLPITISQILPRAFLLETVPGLLNHESLAELQLRLDKLKDYVWDIKILCASHFGCPTKRFRVIIIGIRVDVSPVVTFPSAITLRDNAMRMKNVLPEILYVCGGRGQKAAKMKNADGFMPTITATRNIKIITRKGEKRWLTIPEVLLFSGFPADWQFAPNYFGKDSELKNWERIGNAVPPPLARSVGAEIKMQLEAHHKLISQ